MTEKRNQRELLWFQTGGALNFITAAPHCGDVASIFERLMAKDQLIFFLNLIKCTKT
jgi:hypothetical protein